MTEREAIKNVTAYVYMECENMPQQVIKALDIMKNCTEKQIAKKLHNYYCPICRYYFEDGESRKYCPECGQKILLDWWNEDAE